jgi:hypothetical protein
LTCVSILYGLYVSIVCKWLRNTNTEPCWHYVKFSCTISKMLAVTLRHKSVIFCCFWAMVMRAYIMYIKELFHNIVHIKAVILAKAQFLLYYTSWDIELGRMSLRQGLFFPD